MTTGTLPKQVLIIRHAEKPGDPGTDAPGEPPDLSTRGYIRAAGLAIYIPQQFGRPDFLIATKESPNSNRPIETITPLAKSLRLEIDSDHGDSHYDKVAADILGNEKYAGKLVLICWHHGMIPALATALGGQPPIEKWPGTVFDRVWQISYPTDRSNAANLPVANLP